MARPAPENWGILEVESGFYGKWEVPTENRHF